MKNLIIFGNRDFGRMIKYYIDTDDKRKVVAFTVNEEFIEEDTFCDLPVTPFEKIEDNYSPDKYEILIAIGNSKMNKNREAVFREIKEKGYTVASYIHSNAVMHCENIGEGNIILEKCMI